jgi:hypothetical protein
MAISFGLAVGSRSYFYEFLEVVFLVVPMESLLVEEEVLSRENEISV